MPSDQRGERRLRTVAKSLELNQGQSRAFIRVIATVRTIRQINFQILMRKVAARELERRKERDEQRVRPLNFPNLFKCKFCQMVAAFTNVCCAPIGLLHLSTHLANHEASCVFPGTILHQVFHSNNAGRQGRLVTEGMDQWITGSLINTTNGASLATIGFREGDGEFDPTGRYYYHVDNNSSGASIQKYDTISNGFVGAGSSGTRGSYYGSRNLVIIADGLRLFWTRVVFDANLASYDMVPGEVYSCSTNGGSHSVPRRLMTAKRGWRFTISRSQPRSRLWNGNEPEPIFRGPRNLRSS